MTTRLDALPKAFSGGLQILDGIEAIPSHGDLHLNTPWAIFGHIHAEDRRPLVGVAIRTSGLFAHSQAPPAHQSQMALIKISRPAVVPGVANGMFIFSWALI